jgi:hypothetical protein
MHEKMKKIKVIWGSKIVKEGGKADKIYIAWVGEFEILTKIETDKRF